MTNLSNCMTNLQNILNNKNDCQKQYRTETKTYEILDSHLAIKLMLKDKKNKFNNAAKRYINYKTNNNLHIKRQTRKEYNKAVKLCLTSHIQTQHKDINEAFKNNETKLMWNLLNKQTKVKHTESDTGNTDFSTHFREVAKNHSFYEDEVLLKYDFSFGYEPLEGLHAIDSDISKEEILKSIEKLKNNKSSGHDKIYPETLKYLKYYLVDILKVIFNHCLSSGEYPDNWAISGIIPVYKNKGDKSNPNNYRGISLQVVISKVFCSIINNRLLSLFESNNVLNDTQFGFRKGYSTIDQCFNLELLLEYYVNVIKKPIFTCFVDFEKAFDKVHHATLWYKLIQRNINGKLFRIIQNMYIKAKSYVIDGNTSLNDLFSIDIGVLQGNVLSTTLFAYFLVDLEELLEIYNHDPLKLGNILRIFLLLYADDLVLFSETAKGLQYSLDTLEMYCRQNLFKVNITKTKIIIFSNKQKIKNNKLEFFYLNNTIEIVDSIKYLGIWFQSNKKYNRHIDQTITKSYRIMYALLNKVKDSNYSIELIINLFDSLVKSVMLYGCEVWADNEDVNINKLITIEAKFYKLLFGLPLTSSNKFIYGELGILPLNVIIHKRAIAYWLKICHGSVNKYTSLIFNFLINNSSSMLKIKKTLSKLGLGYLWDMQNELYRYDLLSMKNMIFQRIYDIYKQDFNSSINDHRYLNIYSKIKTDYEIEPYLKYPIALNQYKVRLFVALRAEVFGMERWYEKNYVYKCKLCGDCVKKVSRHFICCCSQFDCIRKSLLGMVKINSEYIYYDLMKPKNNKQLTDLIKFLKFIKRSI